MRFARTAVTALVATSALGVAVASPTAAVTTDDDNVFVSELHYDNDGIDTGEAIEVFGPAGTDLAGYSIVLYNGNGGAPYNTVPLSGTLPDLDSSGSGVTVVSLPENGLQNGAPDGLALVDDAGSVRQFLSYEGSFTAVGGPADSMTSTDIGVAESGGTPVGHSLQLTGTGSCYGALEWAAAAPSTFGALGAITPDASVPCGDDPEPAGLRINELHYDNDGTDTGEAVEIFGAAGTDLTGYSIVLYNGSNGAQYGTTALTGTLPDLDGTGSGVTVVTYPSNGIQNGSPDGLALVAPDDTVIEFLSYEGTLTAADGPAAGITSTDIGVAEGSSTAEGLSLQRNDDLTWTGPVCASFGELNDPTAGTDCGDDPEPAGLRINELHYDNDGGDTGEAVEIFGAAGTDLTGYSIVLYNGSASQLNVYDTVVLSGTLPDLDGTGTGVVAEDITGIQNGAPDGLALVAPDGTVVEFISYEGTFTPIDGPAAGITSTDIGVSEAGNEPEGLSLQRNDDLTWTGPVCASFGELNDPTAGTDCGDDGGPATERPIWEVQGSGFASPFDGETVIIDGYVVGDFQGDDSFNGFHVQEPVESSDGDPTTSDGIFVYSNTPVEIGDFVTVTGTVDEFNGLTEISPVESVVVTDSTLTPPSPTPFTLPADDAAREAVEGMLVTLPQDLVISEYFNFDRFNEIVLTTDRQNQPTAVVEPGADAVALAAEQALNRITLDDGRSKQNMDPAIHPNGDPFTLDNLFRGGDLVTNTTGVMDFAFGSYKIQPTQGADYTATNPRPDVPEVGGNLTVASFNVLNYFNTIDDGTNDICGAGQNLECRGADNETERVRQLDKIVAAMAAIGADVFGIIEVENTPGVEAMTDIVDGLNSTFGAGTYDYVDTGVIGTDAIKVGFIYNTTTTATVGDFAILDESVDPRFDTDKNRPALAQTFASTATGGEVTVSVNHLKSKGSDCDALGDPDTGDGQGNCNLNRTAAAEALADWMAADPTGTDAPTLIVGDLNSYDLEDPIDALKAAGYTDLIAQFEGDEAYSYVFDGKVGYLDHALADAELAGSVTGAAVWRINADEADLIDYDTSFKQDAQDAIYAPDPYRSSDHDPVIVGLDLCDAEAPMIDLSLTPNTLPSIGILLPVFADVSAVDNIDGVVDVELVSVESDEPNGWNGGGPWWKRWFFADIIVVDDDTFLLRAERDRRGDGRTYTVTYQATDSCGNTAVASATVEVPRYSRWDRW